ncbi:unnamed protein product [Chrysoparadoxa australica]
MALAQSSTGFHGQVTSLLNESRSVLKDACVKHPNSVEALLLYAEVLTQLGDFGTALSVVSNATAVNDDCPLPFVNAGRAYMAMNDLPVCIFVCAHA